jgi:hypothetical protein
MSGLLVVVAFLAIAAAIVIPTVARASGSPGKPAQTIQVAAAVDYFLKLDGAIHFLKLDGQPDNNIKLSSAECSKLVVVAHKGLDATGPVIAKTNATPGKEPGSCVYSLKVPAGQPVGLEIQSFSWGSSKLSHLDYLKLKEQDKLSWTWQKANVKLANSDWVKASVNGDGKFVKIDFKKYQPNSEVTMPLYVKWMPGQ